MVGRTPVFVSVVVLALAGMGDAQAQDPFIGGDGTSVEPFVAEDLGPAETFSVDLPLRLDLPSFTDLRPNTSYLDQVSMAERIPGSLVIKYRGLQGVVVRYLSRRLKAEWGHSIRASVRTSLTADLDMREARRLRGQASRDHKRGRWWDRRWYHSLTPENGGAPAERQVHAIGSEVTILELGPLTITNEFRGRLDRISFQFDGGDSGFQSDEETESAVEDQTADLERDPAFCPPNSLDLWIGLESGTIGDWGMSAKVKVRPEVHTKLKSSGIVTDLRLKVIVEVAFGYEESKGIEIEFLAHWNPMKETKRGDPDAALEMKITFLRW